MPPKNTGRASIPVIIANTFAFLVRLCIAHFWAVINPQKNTPRSLPHDHSFIPKGPHDSRSPCPALNALANHGYLPRDGRNIRPRILIKALQEGYDLTYPLAAFLTYGGFILLGQFANVSLDDLRRHNQIEHNASLVHEDTTPGYEYAPNVPLSSYMKELEADSSDGKYITTFDVAKARVRREAECKDMDAMHSEIARGEMALVLGIFGASGEKIPMERLRYWLMKESFPPGWSPENKQTLIQTVRTSARLRAHMNNIKGRTEKLVAL